MNELMKINRKNLSGGTTLAETLVAVSITVAMLLITGMVFNSATTASGQAAANTEIMHQYRTLARQLEADLAGLLDDMPLAIIFEEKLFDPDLSIVGDEYPVRSDRMVFYANGDFQTLEGLSGNAARIFYGQTLDNMQYPYNDLMPLPENLLTPPRRILARRAQLFTAAVWGQPVNTPERFDYCPCINYSATALTSLSYWKGLTQANYLNSILLSDYENDIVSLIRRPSILKMTHPDPAHPLPKYAPQRVFMLPDVTDFKIQFWYFDNPAGKWRWFPNQYDMEVYNDVLYNYSLAAFENGNFALAWNIPQAVPMSVYDINSNSTYWIFQPPGHVLNNASGQYVLKTVLPRALKFTFTLYDQNRRRFPEGQTFSYIVKLHH